MQLTYYLHQYLQSFSGLTKKSWHGIFICLLETTATGIAFYISIYLVVNLHFSVVIAGLVLSSYGIGTVLGGLVGGLLSDSKSPNFVVIISLLLECFLFSTMPFLTNIKAIIIDVLILGISAYMFKTANTIQVVSANQNLSASMRLKSINVLYTASNVGLGASAVLIGILANFGFSYLFFGAGMMTLLLAIYQTMYMGNVQVKESEPTIANSVTDGDENYTKRPVKKVILVILASLFIVGLIISQRRTTYSIYIHDLFPQYGMHGLGLLYAINPAMIILLQTPLVNKLKNFNKFYIVGIGAAFMGIGTWLLSYGNPPVK